MIFDIFIIEQRYTIVSGCGLWAFIINYILDLEKYFQSPNFIKSKKRKISHSIPTFNWENVSNLKLGIGSFGIAYSANYVGATDNGMVVVKKLRRESEDAKRRFFKEAEMLNTMKHQNITRFFGFSDSPYGIMMENVAFDLAPFGLDKAVTTLEDFYHYVDCECNFESFSEVLPVCMRDAVASLDYLHRMDIAHRDFKPGNILVSNKHYQSNMSQSSIAKEYERCPIVVKLTDFGLSRSLDVQTQSILESRTSDIYRGTPAYMAPEVHTGSLTTARMSDLKKTDIWSLGIIAYAMENPNLAHPYHKESEKLGLKFDNEITKHFMEKQQLPKHDTKYESLRVTEWWQVEILKLCAKFDPDSRPLAADVLGKININDPEYSLLIKPLSVSQNSALEKSDASIANKLQTSMPTANVDRQIQLLDDGTNACTFLAIAICDTILNEYIVKLPHRYSYSVAIATTTVCLKFVFSVC